MTPTSSDNPQYWPDDDRDIVAWLNHANAPPPDEAFLEELAHSLDAEFARTRSAHVPGEVLISEEGRPDDGASERRGSGRRDDGFVSRRGRRSSVARWISAIAVTASALFVMLMWQSSASYSWAKMLQAMEHQPWIETDTSEDGITAWLSSKHRRMVVRFENGGESMRSRDAEADRLSSGETETLLLRFILDFCFDHDRRTAVDATNGFRVTGQNWRNIQRDGLDLVELNVQLERDRPNQLAIHLVLLLDPSTQLPQECRVEQVIHQSKPLNAATRAVRFDYRPSAPPDVVAALTTGPEVTVAARDVLASTEEIVPTAATERQDGNAAIEEAPEETAAVLDTSRTTEEIRTAHAGPTEELVRRPEALSFGELTDSVPAVADSADLSRTIDRLLNDCWQAQGITPVERCRDSEFARRAYLDLTGRIPTVSEIRSFLDDDSATAREQLIDRILNSRDHATHMAAVWRAALLPSDVDLTRFGGTERFETWLAERFRANVPYDEIVRELLLAEGRLSESGPVLFYAALKMEPERLAARTSRAFLGVRMECAQCHDHFFDKRWKQTDFWGYAAFFAQISRPQGKMEEVSPVLRVLDTNRGEVSLPGSENVINPRFPLGSSARASVDGPSRRQQLADWLTQEHNPQFARATANRIWAHLFGRGIVDPVDDIRPDNTPVCAELLDALAKSLVATRYDLRTLIRGIVLSDVWQRSSRADAEDSQRLLYFAQMPIKTFSAEQLYDSLTIATGRISSAGGMDGLLRTGNSSRQAFLSQFQAPTEQATDFHLGIPQALTLMNGGIVRNATTSSTSGLLRSLSAPFFTDEQRIETLFLATLGRRPDDDETAALAAHMAAGDGSKMDRLGDILWALLNSPEFTLNH